MSPLWRGIVVVIFGELTVLGFIPRPALADFVLRYPVYSPAIPGVVFAMGIMYQLIEMTLRRGRRAMDQEDKKKWALPKTRKY